MAKMFLFVFVLVCGVLSSFSVNYVMVCCLNAEEMLATNFALWWSPDGAQILYASFNDTVVGSFSFPKYGSLEERLQYTEIESILYPKVSFKDVFWDVVIKMGLYLENIAVFVFDAFCVYTSTAVLVW